jgi:hypothetical protein
MKRVPYSTRQFTAGAFQPGEAGATQMLRSLGSGDRGPALAGGLGLRMPVGAEDQRLTRTGTSTGIAR